MTQEVIDPDPQMIRRPEVCVPVMDKAGLVKCVDPSFKMKIADLEIQFQRQRAPAQ
jgi:hypothetical protein